MRMFVCLMFLLSHENERSYKTVSFCKRLINFGLRIGWLYLTMDQFLIKISVPPDVGLVDSVCGCYLSFESNFVFNFKHLWGIKLAQTA